MSDTWIAHNIYSTSDAIKYSTSFEGNETTTNFKKKNDRYKTGGFDSL